MLIYKDDKTCNCDQAQLPAMKKAGWSVEKPEPKPEGKPEGKPEAKSDAKPTGKK